MEDNWLDIALQCLVAVIVNEGVVDEKWAAKQAAAYADALLEEKEKRNDFL